MAREAAWRTAQAARVSRRSGIGCGGCSADRRAGRRRLPAAAPAAGPRRPRGRGRFRRGRRARLRRRPRERSARVGGPGGLAAGSARPAGRRGGRARGRSPRGRGPAGPGRRRPPTWTRTESRAWSARRPSSPAREQQHRRRAREPRRGAGRGGMPRGGRAGRARRAAGGGLCRPDQTGRGGGRGDRSPASGFASARKESDRRRSPSWRPAWRSMRSGSRCSSSWPAWAISGSACSPAEGHEDGDDEMAVGRLVATAGWRDVRRRRGRGGRGRLTRGGARRRDRSLGRGTAGRTARTRQAGRRCAGASTSLAPRIRSRPRSTGPSRRAWTASRRSART